MFKTSFSSSKILYLIIISFVIFMQSSCKTIDVRGNYVSVDSVNDILDTKMTSKQVVAMLGEPNYVPDYKEKVWYYIQRSVGRRSVLANVVTDQRIVKVEFDEDGMVSDARFMDEISHRELKMIDKTTNTPGIEKTVLQKFVSNVGKFNKKKKKAKRKGIK